MRRSSHRVNRAALAVGLAAATVAGLSATVAASTAPPEPTEPAGSAAMSGETLTIGMVSVDAQGFYGGVRKGVIDGAAESGLNVEVNEVNAGGDPAKENDGMSQFIAADVDAIVLSASSADGSVAGVEAAAEAGIPVVCYNTCINEADMAEYIYAYAYGDPVDMGHQLGEAAAAYFAEAGIDAPQIGVLNCEFVEVCVQRREGFEAALTEAELDYTIVDNQEATVLDDALRVGGEMLTANPDLDAFMGESGGATEGAIRAVEEAGTDTVVFGHDMTTAIAEALQDNSILKAEVDVSGQELGRITVQAALDAIDGVERDDLVIPAPIHLYTDADQGGEWLEAHADGIP